MSDPRPKAEFRKMAVRPHSPMERWQNRNQTRKRIVTRVIGKLLVAISVGLSLLFGYFYYTQYFRWRDCFDDSGRCFDANTGVVYHDQSGGVWLVLALVTICVALILIWRLGRHR